MTITEYKEKFAALYSEMCKEHGKAQCVHIEATDTPLYSADGGPYYTSVTIGF